MQAVTFPESISMSSQLFPWKHSSFFRDHKDHKVAELNIFNIEFLLLPIHHLAIDSKSLPIEQKNARHDLPNVVSNKTLKKQVIHIFQLIQNKQVLSSTCLRLCKLFLVKVLLLASNQRKTWILGGTVKF
jgi:hypothetical protein